MIGECDDLMMKLFSSFLLITGDVNSDITSPLSDHPVFTRSDKCKLKATWHSFYACPICGPYTSDDYTVQATECENSIQRISYVRTADCFGSAVLNVHDESCTPKYAFPMYVLITVAALFLLLTFIALLVYLRYRSLTTKYSLLVEEKSKNLEMSDIQSNSSSQSAEDISAR